MRLNYQSAILLRTFADRLMRLMVPLLMCTGRSNTIYTGFECPVSVRGDGGVIILN